MKKILAAICIFAALMGTLGCGGSQTAGNNPAEKKELIVGTEPSFAPFEFPDKKSGEITGFDMELIKAMGKKAGFAKVTVKGMGFDALIPALDAGNIDVAIAGMSITDARKQKVNFTDPYYESGLATLVRKDNTTIKSLNDLKGKTIVTTGKGTTPEYVLRYILTENGVDPDNDVTLDFYSEATEALAQLQAGTSTIAMLPQPFVTSALAQVEGLRVALDMNEEWEKVAGSKLVTGVLVARKDAVEADPARFAAFMDGYKASVEAANTDLENTAALCEQYGIVAKAALAQKALPNCNIVFETGDEMKTDLETYFNVLYAADPTSVGGQLPADDFYYAG